ncbi:MAG: hypothetical protein Q8O20_06310 [Sulfuricurvum sp.]|uniref:hypothetical protein n=1 Tax=Sulfuricurvum sp. TaxID=2025608 RepID=UPI0027346911|nr:hypothetical protein [Sulfuricurvum sp.]MDP2850671.1 hypothetical protein [Sulfuricurvum sp.]
MNPAKRIENILIKIPKSGEKQALKAFEKIFDVKEKGTGYLFPFSTPPILIKNPHND